MEYNPSGRVQRIGSGDLLPPGTCILCGTGFCDDGFIDFGVNLEWFGQIYFCATCALEIGGSVGAYSSAEVNHINGLFNVAVEERNALKERLDNAESELHTLRGAIRIVSDNGSVVDSPPDNLTDFDELSGETEKLLAGVNSPEGNNDSEPNQPDSGDGPHDGIGSERSDATAIGL